MELLITLIKSNIIYNTNRFVCNFTIETVEHYLINISSLSTSINMVRIYKRIQRKPAYKYLNTQVLIFLGSFSQFRPIRLSDILNFQRLS